MWILLALILLTASNVWAAGSPVRIDDGDTVTDQADITVTSAAAVLIKASSSTRTVLSCSISEPVRWGTSAITTTRGQLIAGGASAEFRNTAAIYMIAESDDSTVSCTEESSSSASGPIFSP